MLIARPHCKLEDMNTTVSRDAGPWSVTEPSGGAGVTAAPSRGAGFLITPGTYPLAVLCDLRNVPLYMPTEVLKLNRNSYAGNGPGVEPDYDADRYAEMRA